MRHQSGDACFIGNFRRDFLKIEFFEFFVRDQNRAGGGYAFLTALSYIIIIFLCSSSVIFGRQIMNEDSYVKIAQNIS